MGETTFTGFPVAGLDFYEDLENDNSKAFWTEHKHVYDASVRAPLEALATSLAGQFGPAKLFRPYRDVRFSKDKTPYKTHQGAWFTESSRYVQISAAGLFVAAGYWEATPARVDRLRRAVADDMTGAQVEALLAALPKGFVVGGDTLVRVPPAYPKDHPRADLLRHKSLTVSREIGSPAWLSTPRAKAEIAKLLTAFGPVVSWLDANVGSD
ncbi:MAG: DUF2461 domain-containing protein [Mycobacteriales bacterium]